MAPSVRCIRGRGCRAVGNGQAVGWRSYCALVAVMVLVTVDVLVDGPLRQLDHAVHGFVDTHVRGGWLEVAHVGTKLGQRGDLVLIIVPLSVVASVRARSPRCLVLSVLIVVGLSLLQSGLKSVV